MTEPRDDKAMFDLDERGVTPEVGEEGGSLGDVEIGVDRGPGAGGEATETWRPAKKGRDVIVRDEPGEGRRSP